jgi:thioredoxin-dependent peroxiredoxin
VTLSFSRTKFRVSHGRKPDNRQFVHPSLFIAPIPGRHPERRQASASSIKTGENFVPIAVDQPVPDFTAPATGGEFTLSSLRGKKVVLFFYPKDNTPGCTTESLQFRDLYSKFKAAGAEIVGISRDSVKSHDNFKAKLELPYTLVSDADEAICSLFGVIKMKKMYGKEVRGIERSTFLLDAAGVLRREFRGVKVPGHVEQIVEAVQAL